MTQAEHEGGQTDATASPEALLERAIAARKDGELARAAGLLDRVMEAVPRHPLPLRLRARIALERGEPEALSRFDVALRQDPGNADLHLGKAQALEQAGDLKGATIVASQIAQQAPGFIEALSYLSSLLLATGETDFAAPFANAARKVPQDPNIAAAHCDALAGIDRFAEAAAIAAQASQRFPDEEHFVLLEATHAGAAGDWPRAAVLFEKLKKQTPQRWLAEARHRLRGKEIDVAAILIDRVLEADPWDIAAWALRGLVWRLTGTPQDTRRAEWLHGQPGLVTLLPLSADEHLIGRARTVLDGLHATTGMPLSQSVRGGSQTRGVLFQRTEAVLAELHEAVLATIKAYREALPPADPAHPLLRHRDRDWRLAGSWSVKLAGGGDRHASHIHPAGLISSALYLTLPPELGARGQDGFLEIGRPPANLGLDLEPLATIEPKVGHLALFPSTLYHGTQPFSGTEHEARMTVAFDVASSVRNHNASA